MCLARHFETKSFTHNTVEWVTILSIHLFFYNFAGKLDNRENKIVRIRWERFHFRSNLTMMSTPVAPEAFSILLEMWSFASFSTIGSMSVSWNKKALIIVLIVIFINLHQTRLTLTMTLPSVNFLKSTGSKGPSSIAIFFCNSNF